MKLVVGLFVIPLAAQIIGLPQPGMSSYGGSISYNGYSHYRDITINPLGTLVPSTLTNFPVLISGTFSYLAVVGSGGNIQNTTTLNGQTVPADLVFTSDSGCVTNLNWEVASYTTTTGAIEVWVQIPSLGTASQDVYMCYNNALITTYQGNSTSVWDTNYKLVYHLSEATNAQAKDSTSNANNSTTNSSTQVTGQIGKGQSFVKASTNSIITPRIFTTQADYTISGWISVAAADYGVILDHRVGGTNGPLFYTVKTTGKAASFFNPPSSEADSIVTAADSTWHYIVGTRSGTNQSIYVDGNSPVTITQSVSTAWGTAGRISEDSTGVFYTQLADEIRVSAVARVANWIKTEWNNQSAPSSFSSIGAEN